MVKNFIIQHRLPDTVLSRFQYVIDFINAHPLKPTNLFFIVDNQLVDKDLFYGNSHGDFFNIPLDACFLDETKVLNHYHSTQFSYLQEHSCFAVSDKKIGGDQFIQNTQFGFDILNTLFFHISRYEEYYAPTSKNGPAGWLDEKQHFLIKNNLCPDPVVDQLLVAFFEIITDNEIKQRTTYAISHDVDILFRFKPSYKLFRSLAATVVQQRGWSQFWDSIGYYKKMMLQEVQDPYDYFDKLFRLEDQWVSKQIFMMAGGNTKYDNKYRIGNSDSKKIIQLAIERGYSIGLHPSYNAGFEASRFEEEQKTLTNISQQTIIANRQHWLRWSWEITPYLFEKNGIITDSTMGYSRHLGFRCGTGFPYQMYDFKGKKAFNWTENPMGFMESAAIHQAYQTGENLTELMRNFILKNKKNTHLMLNFHNSNFDPLLDTGRQLRHFYENELMDLCYS